MPGNETTFNKAMNAGHSAAWDQMWDKAAASYQAALSEFPDHPKALNSLGLALYQLDKFDEALQVYIRAAKASPDDPTPFEKLGHIYERMGGLREAIQAAMQAAELYLKTRDPEKAIENWVRVLQLDPENVQARSRLAMVHEKMGQAKAASAEYIALASLIQRSGNPQQTNEILDRASALTPDSPEVKQAKAMIKAGQLLPKPVRPKGGTGPIRMAQVKQMEQSPAQVSSLDPISEAKQKALGILAEVLFEMTDESTEAQTRRGLQAIMKGTGQLSMPSDQTKILLHLSQAIDAQTKGSEDAAADELERAHESGFKHSALSFNLGYLRSKGERLESALRNLQQCVKHKDYGLGARLLSGQILRKLNRSKEAGIEYLEALKIADALVVPADQADSIRQLYEPLIESQAGQTDEKAILKLCDNIEELLAKPNWRGNLAKSRSQMPTSASGQALPLAEILIQAQSSQVIESMNTINQYARDGHLRSAMDEAFYAIHHAPTYLPLHALMGDLLISEGRNQEAITKFTVVAQAYSVRGEAAQATNMLKRVIQLSPMDLASRTRLIDQLTARGQLDEAIGEYLELADIYYRLAELDMARKTYTTALRLSQQPNANHSWNIQILNRMADIDMQRLDWRQAVRVYEQIRTLVPDDENVRKNLIELNLRLGQTQQAIVELENFTAYLDGSGNGIYAIKFVEELTADQGHQPHLRRILADLYRRAKRIPEAIAQLDAAGDAFLTTGDRQAAAEAINQIILMNPPNVEDYKQALAQLRG
jgi:tetratricopeptide (TPR) repeat protein